MNKSASKRSRDDELKPYARALIPPGTKATSSLFLRSRSVNELRPHPRYRELCGPIPKMTLFAMSEKGEVLFEEPLVVDNSGTIVDGYKRWMLAKKQQRSHLLCLEYSSNSDEDTFRLLAVC